MSRVSAHILQGHGPGAGALGVMLDPWTPIRTSRCETTCGCSASCSATRCARRPGERALPDRRAGARAGQERARAAHDADFLMLADELLASCRSTTRCRWRARSRTSCTWPTSPSSITASAAGAPISAIRRAPPQRGSCEDGFARLLAGGITPERLHEAVCALRIELVLTAHPTEVARRTLVQKYNRIAAALRDARPPRSDAARARGADRRRCAARSRRRGRPSEVRAAAADAARRGAQRPDRLRAEPVGRAAALPARRRPRAAWRARARRCRIDAAPIRFGSWIGGDRDGNPNVTPRGDAAGVPAVAVGGGGPVSARRSTRCATSCRSTSASAGAARATSASAASRIASCCATVRSRLLATRDVGRGVAASATQTSRRRPSVYLDVGAARRAAAAVPSRRSRRPGNALIADGRLTDLLRRVGGLRRRRWRGSTSGRTPRGTPTRSTRSPRRSGSARTRTGTSRRASQFLHPRAGQPRGR